MASGCTETADDRVRAEMRDAVAQLECVKEKLLRSTSETNAVKEKLDASEHNRFNLNKTLEEVQVSIIPAFLGKFNI